MRKAKTIVKKTKSGKVMKIVGEHYLRDDIRCGSEVKILSQIGPALSSLSFSPPRSPYAAMDPGLRGV